jgi:hypothetical protein
VRPAVRPGARAVGCGDGEPHGPDGSVRQGPELCDQGRIAHKTATQQLDALARDLGSIIRTMDARNRVRYKDDPQTLAK